MQALHCTLDVVLVQILPYNCSETDYSFCEDLPPQGANPRTLYPDAVLPSEAEQYSFKNIFEQLTVELDGIRNWQICALFYTSENQKIRGSEAKKIVGAEGVWGRGWNPHPGRVESGVLLGANPRKSCNRFPNNYNAEFGLKQHLICGLHMFIFIFHLLD